jgi:3-dehydroquinate synthase
MESLSVDLGTNSYPVHVGSDLLMQLGELARRAGLKPGRAVLVTDSNVTRLYSASVLASVTGAGFDAQLIDLAPGEPSKSLAVLEHIYDRMAEAELDRSSAVFGLGGGVVGDIAGFAAATYLRGLPLVQIPTTMLAQVDSAIGGKTAVNHRTAKNLIGAFYQPRLVVADTATLATLPQREFREGLAEVIKYGAIMDASFISRLERSMEMILAREQRVLTEMIARSARYKAQVVASDERESGLRKILNFGHTLGHALEASSGYGTWLHGEAVAIGMVAAARLSSRYAGLDTSDAERLEILLGAAGLPTDLPSAWLSGEFVRALRLDKKRTGDGVEFVLLDRLGHAITRKLAFEEITLALSSAAA